MNIRMKRILCAVDFSHFSKGVIEYGKEFSRKTGSRLLVFHSVFSPQDPLYGSTLFERGGEQENRISEASEAIRKLMADADVDWEPVISVGDPVVEVIRVGRDREIDLVIAASHGLSGFKRMFLGTVVERIANRIPYPVMVVRWETHFTDGGMETPARPEPREIAVCCGFSRESRRLVEFGVGMALLWKSSLTLIHSIEAPAEQSSVQFGCGSYRDIQKYMQDRFSAQLLDLIPAAVRNDIPSRAVILQGVPGEQIMHYTKTNWPDLLIAGIRHHGPIEKFIIGTTTRTLLRHSPISVLTVPTPPEEMEPVGRTYPKNA
ncbi:MAG: universal stress protein [Thermodesulfobacteriota bacterium]